MAGIALTMGLGKTLIGLRDRARPLARCLTKLPASLHASYSGFLAPLQEAYKLGLGYLLDYFVFTTYRSLGNTLAVGTYHKLYLDECPALEAQAAAWLRGLA